MTLTFCKIIKIIERMETATLNRTDKEKYYIF